MHWTVSSIRRSDDRHAATVSVSRHRSHLLRDGRELVGSLKCHIHQLGRQGDRAHETKLHISEYVCASACIGTGGSSPIGTHSQGLDFQLLAWTPQGLDQWHHTLQPRRLSNWNNTLFFWCSIILCVCGRRWRVVASTLMYSDASINWIGLHILHFPSHTRGTEKNSWSYYRSSI